jgi:hypothetical protein
MGAILCLGTDSNKNFASYIVQNLPKLQTVDNVFSHLLNAVAMFCGYARPSQMEGGVDRLVLKCS